MRAGGPREGWEDDGASGRRAVAPAPWALESREGEREWPALVRPAAEPPQTQVATGTTRIQPTFLPPLVPATSMTVIMVGRLDPDCVWATELSVHFTVVRDSPEGEPPKRAVPSYR